MSKGNGTSPSKRPSVTLHDVAEAAGVHPSTVSRALDPASSRPVREATRVMIEETARKLGYRPHLLARGLKGGRSGAVGVVVADIGNVFFAPIIRGIALSLEDSSMMPTVAETQDDSARLKVVVDHLMSRQVDALVVLAARHGDREFLESVAEEVPVVLADRPLKGTTLPRAGQDNRAGGRLIAEHLLALGHRDIAQLAGSFDVGTLAERAEGFSETLRDAGIEELPIATHAETLTPAEGTRVMHELLSRARVPTAVFAHNDLLAVGAIAALRARGIRVPEDISIVGYDDMPLAGYLSPPLTTVAFQGLEIGRLAGDMVQAQLRGEATEDVVLPPRLMVRGTTRRLPV
ncbi:MAG: LacI family DNA-binding transcriptional regulator [Acidimicrobiia bacterium]|nr:MAG: LacI family DNA-binding transcriptional regulator [Acidimicrobiia bacterium]